MMICLTPTGRQFTMTIQAAHVQEPHRVSVIQCFGQTGAFNQSINQSITLPVDMWSDQQLSAACVGIGCVCSPYTQAVLTLFSLSAHMCRAPAVC